MAKEKDKAKAGTPDVPAKAAAGVGPELLQFALDRSDEELYITDPNGRFLLVNERTCRSLGYSRGEMLMKKVSDIDPNYPPEAWQKHWQKLKQKKSFSLQTVHCAKDGRTVAKEISVNYFEFGGREYNCALARDITEKQKNEEALKRSEARQKALLKALPDLMFVLDKNGVFLDYYTGSPELLLASPETFMGQKAQQVLPPEVARKTLEGIGQVMAGREPFGFEYSLPILGQTRQYEARLTSCGKDQVMALIRDITLQKTALQDLKQEKDLSRNIVETAQAVILILDTQGRIVSFNPFLEKLSGHRLEEVKGRDWFTTFLPPCDYDKIRDLFKKAIGNIKTSGNINPIMTKDGRQIEVEWYDQTLKDGQGRIIGLLSIGQDVTAKMETERQVARASRVLRMVSASNQALIRAASEKEMIDQICRKMVELGGYHLAWVRLSQDDQARTLKPIAWYGPVAETLGDIEHQWSDEKWGAGPAEQALKEAKTIVVNEVAKFGDHGAWKKHILGLGLNSSLALPLAVQGQLLGILSLFSTQVGAFHPEEVNLLEELAGDLAFGLWSLRQKQEKLQQGEELSRTKQQLEYIMGATKTNLDIIDGDFNLLYVDPAWVKTYGPYQGKKCYDYFMERTAVCPGCGIPKALATKKVTITEEVLVKENNRLIEVHTIPMQDRSGRWVVGEFNIDITDRQKKQAALQESEAKYRSLVEQALEGIVIAQGPPPRLVFANQAMVKILGYTVEELMALKPEALTSLVHPADREMFWGRFRDRLAGKELPARYEFRGIKKDGGEVWLEISSRLIDYQGRPGIQALFSDISARKTAEKNFLETKKMAELYLDLIGDIIVSLDVQGRVTLLNAKGYELLEYAPGELTGRPWFDIAFPDSEKQAVKETFAKIIRGELPAYEHYNNSIISRTGRQLMISWHNTYSRNEQGGIIGTLSSGQDITERQRIQTALSASEEQFREVLETIREGITVSDEQGIFYVYNPEMERLTGYTMAEVNAAGNFLEILYPDPRQRAIALEGLENLRQQGLNAQTETQITTKSGQKKYILTSSAFIDFRGRQMYLSAYRDVSELERLKTVIERLAHQDELILAAAGEGIMGMNELGQITFVNPAALRLFGYQPEKLNGRNEHEIVHHTKANGSGYPIEQCPIQRTLRDGLTRRINDEVFWRRDGKSFPVEYTATAIREGDRVVGVEVVFSDVTERKRADEEIRRLSRALEQSPSVVIITDVHGLIQYVNPKFIEMTGYTFADVAGQPPGRFAFPEIGSENSGQIDEALRTGGEWRGEFMNRRKNGQLYWISAYVSPVRDAEGRIINQLIVAEDITERKRLERVKDDFIGTVSHELRTPLAVVKEGLLQLLDGLHGQMPPQQTDLLKLALGNAERLKRIVNNLLDVSKIEAGKVELFREDVDLAEVVKKIVREFEPLAAKQGLDLKTELPAGPLVANVDPDKIIQVFSNLIGNSLKFTDRGRIEVALVDRGAEAEAYVADTGCGIGGDDLPRVFNKFEQFGRLPASGERGTGLGLAISKGIIDAHGGRISIESRVGQGTKVVFTLPKRADPKK